MANRVAQQQLSTFKGPMEMQWKRRRNTRGIFRNQNLMLERKEWNSMEQLDAEVEFMCWVAVVTAAGSAVALFSGLFWCIRSFSVTGHFWRDWTRFQKLSFCSCMFGIPVYLASVAEIILVMHFAAERLTKPAGTEPFVSSQGSSMLFVSLAELIGQVLLPVTVFCYFLVLMERLAAYQFLLPRRNFQVIYTSVFVLGVILFLAMEAPNIMINVLPASPALVKVAVLLTALLIIASTIIEWTLSIALCRTFLFRIPQSTPPQGSWSLARRSIQQTLSLPDLEKSHQAPHPSSPLYPPNASSPSRSTPSRSSTTHGNRTPTLQLNSTNSSAQLQSRLVSEAPSHISSSGTSFKTVIGDPDKRRTVLLFFGFALTDLVGYVIYGLGLIPGSDKLARPLSIMGRSTIGLHIVLTFIFLDSFKEMLGRRDVQSSIPSMPSTRR
ncbi:hypothetical protein BJ742DRAFT_801988 [Cladochytrium replicatum]|nr:hypothetical protein BJ742DRAFT_801988 [Cladochytrium replicatum]